MTRRSHIPAEASVLTPYICPRDCARAIEWYGEVFGATEDSERYVDPDGRVGHAMIRINGAPLMLSDAYPDYGAVAPAPGNRTATFSLQLYVPDADATMRTAEQAGATVQRPAADQFYGGRTGTLIDPFGIRWMISTHKRDASPEELAKAASEFRKTGAEPGPVA